VLFNVIWRAGLGFSMSAEDDEVEVSPLSTKVGFAGLARFSSCVVSGSCELQKLLARARGTTRHDAHNDQ
jgi:hypothetical protein